MSLNFNQILHQMRFKLLNSTAPTNNTPPYTLPNSDQLTNSCFLKKFINQIYKSRSNDIKFPASLPLFKRKKFLLAGFTLLFISLPIAYLSLQSAKPAKAAWFDDNWAYRKAISIPSHTDSETNVYVTVPSFDATDTTRFQSDCGDLRFTKQNGELLPYYVVDCDATATVHVQFDTLPAGASTYFMYYGNPSVQNGTEAADFSTAASGLGDQTLASEEQSQGPVAYWKFDEGYGTNTNNSTSVTGINGTLSGTTKPAWKNEEDCIAGKCLYFDGSTSYITAANHNAYNFTTGNFTLSAWIRTSNTTQDMAIMDKYNTAASEAGFDFRVNSSTYGGKLELMVSAGLNGGTGRRNLRESTTAVNDGKWHHVVVVRDAGVSTKFYIDGVYKSDAGTNNAGDLSNTDTFGIGKHVYTSYGTYFNGFIDEVKIYPYARTAAQIKSDYASRGSVKGTSATIGNSNQQDYLSNGLVGYWKMNTGVGTTEPDSSGNSNLATLGVGTSAPTWTAGKFGNGLSFDGSNDYVQISGSIPANTTSGGKNTVSFWMYWDGVTGKMPFAWNTNYYDLWFGSSTCFGFNTASSDAWGFNPTGLANRWVHLTAIFNNGSVQSSEIYIDGVKQTLTQCLGSAATKTLSNTAAWIGTWQAGGYNFGGKIDDVRIYNRALSPKEVRDLYNWAPGPVVHLKMDEGSGTSAYDSSGNANTGTLTNSPAWASGKYGKGIAFTASSNKTVRLSTNALAGYKAFTIGTWAYQSSATAGALFAASVGGQYWRSTNGTNLYLFMQPTSCTGSSAWAVNSAVSTGWHYYTITIDSSGNLSFYKDGVLFSTTTFSSTFGLTWDSPCTTSTHWTDIGNYAVSNGWAGTLDEFKIYNYPRTSKQIVEDMNAGHPTGGSPIASQLGYYKFDEGYGTTVNNIGIGGTALNGSLGVGNSAPSWSNSGKFGKALSFDGSNDYLALSNRISMSSDFSISSWIKASSKATQVIVGTNQNTGGLRLSNTNITLGPSGTYVATWSGARPSNDTWHHIAVSVNRTSDLATLYIDGISKGTQSVTNFDWSTSNERFTYFGKDYCSATDCWFNGLIDEVKIYNSALTQDEILLDMNQGAAMVLGSLSDTSGLTGGSVASNSASAAYCIPGDTTSCNSPVAEWKLDEKTGTNVYDTSGNGKTLTVYNSPIWAQGKIGSALKFNGGNSQYAGITDSGTTSLDVTGNLTIEAWVYWNRFKDYGVIVEKGNAGTGASMNYAIWSYSNQATCIIANGSTSNSISINSTNISIGTWHHFACVANGSQLIPYLDGKAFPAANQTITPTANDNLFSISQPSYVIDGMVDQVRLYDYARTPAQIAWDYNRGGPVGWWKMDECQGITANDASGKGNNGTITIGATGTQSVLGTCSVGVGSTAAWGNGSVGKYNSSLNFDGTDDYVTAGTNPITGTSPFTLSSWMKVGSHSTYGLGAYIGTAISGQSAWIGWTASANVGTSNSIGGGFYGRNYGSGINDNNWHHVILSFNGGSNGTALLYVDGVQKVNDTYTPNLASTSIMMGKANTGTAYWYNGQIDEVRVYNYALTPTQVKTLYNENSSMRFGP